MPKAAVEGLIDPVEPDYRFTLANERTFLAWQRTALGLLAAALGAAHFLAGDSDRLLGYSLAAGFGAAAAVTAFGGLLRWRRAETAIRRGAPLPTSRVPLILTGVLTIIGAGVSVSVIAAACLR